MQDYREKRDGRRVPAYGEKGYIRCECTLQTKEERKTICSLRKPPDYSSDSCLYYIDGGYCWLETPSR
jgi:hypothetical protein